MGRAPGGGARGKGGRMGLLGRTKQEDATGEAVDAAAPEQASSPEASLSAASATESGSEAGRASLEEVRERLARAQALLSGPVGERLRAAELFAPWEPEEKPKNPAPASSGRSATEHSGDPKSQQADGIVPPSPPRMTRVQAFLLGVPWSDSAGAEQGADGPHGRMLAEAGDEIAPRRPDAPKPVDRDEPALSSPVEGQATARTRSFEARGVEPPVPEGNLAPESPTGSRTNVLSDPTPAEPPAVRGTPANVAADEAATPGRGDEGPDGAALETGPGRRRKILRARSERAATPGANVPDGRPSVEEAPPAEEAPRVEEALRSEKAPPVEEAPPAEEAPLVEKAFRTEKALQVEKALQAEEALRSEEALRDEEADDPLTGSELDALAIAPDDVLDVEPEEAAGPGDAAGATVPKEPEIVGEKMPEVTAIVPADEPLAGQDDDEPGQHDNGQENGQVASIEAVLSDGRRPAGADLGDESDVSDALDTGPVAPTAGSGTPATAFSDAAESECVEADLDLESEALAIAPTQEPREAEGAPRRRRGPRPLPRFSLGRSGRGAPDVDDERRDTAADGPGTVRRDVVARVNPPVPVDASKDEVLTPPAPSERARLRFDPPLSDQVRSVRAALAGIPEGTFVSVQELEAALAGVSAPGDGQYRPLTTASCRAGLERLVRLGELHEEPNGWRLVGVLTGT